jgi:hypothetical protein
VLEQYESGAYFEEEEEEEEEEKEEEVVDSVCVCLCVYLRACVFFLVRECVCVRHMTILMILISIPSLYPLYTFIVTSSLKHCVTLLSLVSQGTVVMMMICSSLRETPVYHYFATTTTPL